MRPSPTSLLIAAAASLALAAPAAAAAPWNDPMPLDYGSGTPLLSDPVVTGNAAGLAVAVDDEGGQTAGSLPGTKASVFSSGVFLDPIDLGGAGEQYGPGRGQVVSYGQTRLLAAGITQTRTTSQAGFAFGRLTPNRATLGDPRPLGPANLVAQQAKVAVNAQGAAAMLYSVCRNAYCSKTLVYLAVRPAGSSRIASVRLSDAAGRVSGLAAAINARGDALAVWQQGNEAHARVRAAGGTLRATQTVGAMANASSHLTAALSAHRGELVGWVSQAISEGDGAAGTTNVAQARDGSAFNALRLADLPAGTGAYVSGAGVEVAFDPSGRRLLSWTGYDGTHFSVQAAELEGASNAATQTLVDPVTVSDPASDAVLDDTQTNAAGAQQLVLRVGPHGNDTPPGTHDVVYGAARPANGRGAFTLEQIADPADDAEPASAAILPDRVLAVWRSLTSGGRFSQRIG